MATIRLTKDSFNVNRWVTEYGDAVVVLLYTEFGHIKLDQSRVFSIELVDPIHRSPDIIEPYLHYVIKTDSRNIFDIQKATPIKDAKINEESWIYESVNEIEILEGQYQYFGVILDQVCKWREQVTMKDYYEKEFFKSESAV